MYYVIEVVRWCMAVQAETRMRLTYRCHVVNSSIHHAEGIAADR